MRKIVILFLFFPMALLAQEKFGYFSYSKVVEALPEYSSASNEYEMLKKRCNEEIERNEQELTRMYVAYLDGQRDFPEPILRKRQNELQQMVDNSVLFRGRVKEWLAEARDSLYRPCYQAADKALAKVCEALSLDYALDTDAGVYKYMNPEKAVDITDYVIEAALAPQKPITAIAVAAVECAEDTEHPSPATENIVGKAKEETGNKATE